MDYYNYNDYIGHESLNREYKEFSLHDDCLTDEQIEFYCSSNKFDFNELVLSNILRYFSEYLPKYISSFINTNIDGYLYIGVNDNGYIKGIPYDGILPVRNIVKSMYLAIDKYIKYNIRNDIKNYIQIEIHKINYTSTANKPETLVSTRYTNYIKSKHQYDLDYKLYLQKYNEWKLKYISYTGKLADLGNNKITRMMIIDFIKSNDKHNVCISLFESDYIFKQCTFIEIERYKQEHDNPYYWIATWKDYISIQLLLEKPIFTSRIKHLANPIFLINHFDDMVPKWMYYNKNLNLYLFKIKIKQVKLTLINLIHYTPCEYYNFRKNKWLKCKRKLSKHNDPISINF